jgi:flagellar FliJ protein
MELDKLDKVALLARSAENRAAGALQEGRRQLQRSNGQLTQLEQFKIEYEQRLEVLAQDGMEARQLQDYRRFLANLNAAIDRQGQEVARDEASIVEQREAYVDRSVRRESLDMLLERGRAMLLRDQERREQRDSDERALRYHRSEA